MLQLDKRSRAYMKIKHMILFPFLIDGCPFDNLIFFLILKLEDGLSLVKEEWQG